MIVRVSMNLTLDTVELRSQVLDNSLYYVDAVKDAKRNEQVELVRLESYDTMTICDAVANSGNLLGFDKPLIVEIVEALGNNKERFGLDKHHNIGFYFNGKPLLRIRLGENETGDERQVVHVSIQKYRTYKTELLVDKKVNRVMIAGFGGTLFMLGVIIGMTTFRNNN